MASAVAAPGGMTDTGVTPQMCPVRVITRRGRPISIWKMDWAGNIRWGIEWAARPARGSEETMGRRGRRMDAGDRKGASPDLGVQTRPSCLALPSSPRVTCGGGLCPSAWR